MRCPICDRIIRTRAEMQQDCCYICKKSIRQVLDEDTVELESEEIPYHLIPEDEI